MQALEESNERKDEVCLRKETKGSGLKEVSRKEKEKGSRRMDDWQEAKKKKEETRRRMCNVVHCARDSKELVGRAPGGSS
jgi:hypothetical protein